MRMVFFHASAVFYEPLLLLLTFPPILHADRKPLRLSKRHTFNIQFIRVAFAAHSSYTHCIASKHFGLTFNLIHHGSNHNTHTSRTSPCSSVLWILGRMPFGFEHDTRRLSSFAIMHAQSPATPRNIHASLPIVAP